MPLRIRAILTGVLLMVALSLPESAHAYTGPGLGLGAIGAALGILGSILLALLSLIWYPFKRLWRRIKSRQDDDQ